MPSVLRTNNALYLFCPLTVVKKEDCILKMHQHNSHKISYLFFASALHKGNGFAQVVQALACRVSLCRASGSQISNKTFSFIHFNCLRT